MKRNLVLPAGMNSRSKAGSVRNVEIASIISLKRRANRSSLTFEFFISWWRCSSWRSYSPLGKRLRTTPPNFSVFISFFRLPLKAHNAVPSSKPFNYSRLRWPASISHGCFGKKGKPHSLLDRGGVRGKSSSLDHEMKRKGHAHSPTGPFFPQSIV